MSLRRTHIAGNLKELILLTKEEFTVANLLSTIMRPKNFKGIEPYFASDEDVSSVIENMLTELKEEQNG